MLLKILKWSVADRGSLTQCMTLTMRIIETVTVIRRSPWYIDTMCLSRPLEFVGLLHLLVSLSCLRRRCFLARRFSPCALPSCDVLMEGFLFQLTVIQGDVASMAADAVVHPTNNGFFLGGQVGENVSLPCMWTIVYCCFLCWGAALRAAGGAELETEVNACHTAHGTLKETQGLIFCQLRNSSNLTSKYACTWLRYQMSNWLNVSLNISTLFWPDFALD